MRETDEEDEVAAETQTMFDINLNMLIDCLTIYGISVSMSSNTGGTWKSRKRGDDEEERVQGPMDDLLVSLGSKKRKTSMRMSYTGEGYPLKLLLCVQKEPPTKACLWS
jgi:cell cycle checkpoint protein